MAEASFWSSVSPLPRTGGLESLWIPWTWESYGFPPLAAVASLHSGSEIQLEDKSNWCEMVHGRRDGLNTIQWTWTYTWLKSTEVHHICWIATQIKAFKVDKELIILHFIICWLLHDYWLSIDINCLIGSMDASTINDTHDSLAAHLTIAWPLSSTLWKWNERLSHRSRDRTGWKNAQNYLVCILDDQENCSELYLRVGETNEETMWHKNNNSVPSAPP